MFMLTVICISTLYTTEFLESLRRMKAYKPIPSYNYMLNYQVTLYSAKALT